MRAAHWRSRRMSSGQRRTRCGVWAGRHDSPGTSTLAETVLLKRCGSLTRWANPPAEHCRSIALAGILLDAGHADEAVILLREALVLCQAINDPWSMLLVFRELVSALATQGAFASAARFLGAAQALQERTGARPLGQALAGHETAISLARKHLGESAFEQAVAAGQALPLSQAIAEALSTNAPSADLPDKIPRQRRLTARELEVAALIAEGLTNNQIAERMIIAERTVDTHVQNILAKLGCARRTDVAALIGAEA